MAARNVQRVDHVVICVYPENLDNAAEAISAFLDVTLEGPFEQEELGLRLYVDWDSGIEIVAPTDPSIAALQADFLERNGEGLFRMIFGVADLDASLARVAALGYDPPPWRVNAVEWRPAWKSKFKSIDEAFAGTVHGMRVTFGQIEPLVQSDE